MVAAGQGVFAVEKHAEVLFDDHRAPRLRSGDAGGELVVGNATPAQYTHRLADVDHCLGYDKEPQSLDG